MTPEQEEAILGLVHAPGRPPTTSGEEVLRLFDTSDGLELGARLLAGAVSRRDSDDVELALLVCETFGFGAEHLPLLLELAEANWHVSHENVVWYLGNYQSTAVVQALYAAALWVPGYLAFDESRALARKAIWELGRQPGEEARQALAELARSDDEVVRREAGYQLRR